LKSKVRIPRVVGEDDYDRRGERRDSSAKQDTEGEKGASKRGFTPAFIPQRAKGYAGSVIFRLAIGRGKPRLPAGSISPPVCHHACTGHRILSRSPARPADGDGCRHHRTVTQETIHLLETAIAESAVQADPRAATPWGKRKPLPEYEAALKTGALTSEVDSTIGLSEASKDGIHSIAPCVTSAHKGARACATAPVDISKRP
jgi:hypothetical protein